MLSRIRHMIAALGIASVTSPAVACDVALVLAVDVSGSVNSAEYTTQMRGLAEALVDPAVEEALVRGSVAVSVLQWTGSNRQHVSIPWTRMQTYDDTQAMARAVADIPREWYHFSTAIGEALLVSLNMFDDVTDCERRVIDVSGDGYSNEGIPPEELRQILRDAAVTVNGLAIETDQTLLLEYFEKYMITGPGAFAVRAESYEVYPRRIRQKLLRELTKQVASLCDPSASC